MKNNLLQLLKGELTIELMGNNPERVLNLAMQQGIVLTQLKRIDENCISCHIVLSDIRRLRTLMRHTHCRLHIRRRFGLPFGLAFFRRRPLLLVMIPIGAFLLCYASSLVFSLTVSSPYEISAADRQRVLNLAQEAGIRPGHSRWGMDLEAAEEYILDNFPDVFYVEIFVDGISVDVRIVKRINVPDSEQHQPGHILAATDGVIEDVLVRRGTAAVVSGDTVRKGDILIYGWFDGKLTAADGLVSATVYSNGYGECPQRQVVYQETGNTSYSVALQSFDGEIVYLLGTDNVSYEHFSSETNSQHLQLWRKITLPVEIICSEIRELKPLQRTYDQDTAKRRAQALAAARAQAALCGQNITLLGKINVTYEQIELGDNIGRSRASVAALAAIGTFQQFSATEIEQYSQEQEQKALQPAEENANE